MYYRVINPKWLLVFIIGLILLSIFPQGSITAETNQESNDLVENKSLIENQIQSDEAEQRVVITFNEFIDKSIIKGKIEREYSHVFSVSATIPADEVEQLKKNPSIKSIEPDFELFSVDQVMDWGDSVVNAIDALDSDFTDAGIKVAVLDSGISVEHDDLVVTGGVSFVDYSASYDDDFGHGTNVARIIGGKNNDTGVIGVAPDVSIFSVKVLDMTGRGYLSDIIAGIDWSIENHMDIINMSFSTPVDSPALKLAVDEAYSSGLVLVAADGNASMMDGQGITAQYPAKYDSVIAGGTVTQNIQRESFSSTTAPFVSGTLAKLKEEFPSYTNDELLNVLSRCAADVEQTGWHSLSEVGLTYSPCSNSTGNSRVNEGTVTDQVYGDSLIHSVANVSSTGPSVISRIYSGFQYTIGDDTSNWPSLVNAKSIAIDPNYGTPNRYVLYSDNTVKALIKSGFQYTLVDDTSNWPSLINAKAITINPNFGKIIRYVLYNDNTVKAMMPQGGLGYVIVDDTSNWPSLVNAKSIAIDHNFGTPNRYVLYNDNTVKGRVYTSLGYNIVDDTSNWPNLQNARSISIWGNSEDWAYLKYYVGNLDLSPTISIASHSSQTVYKNSAGNTFTITGTVTDGDNDNVTVSATVGGVTKTQTFSNTLTPQSWSLQWNVDTDNIPAGTYTNITVTAQDSLWGNATAIYTGTILVNSVPNIPSALIPGSSSSSTPALMSGESPVLRWTFSDPDTGDVQGGYQVQIYNESGTVLVKDSGWVNSSLSNYTIPANLLTRGTKYRWRVAVKDNKGGISAFSSPVYFKLNNLPNLAITSYTNGQQVPDNVLTFTWTYSDADGQVQAKYRIQGSKDNWATIGYDSGEVASTATTKSTIPLPDGTWNFKILVHDSMEWSVAAIRTNLIVPDVANDNIPPTAPKNLIIKGRTSATITLQWIASTDNIAVASYEIYNGNSVIGSVGGETTEFTVSNVETNTIYTFFVKAKDANENISLASNSLKFIKPSGSIQYHYDNRGRLESVEIPGGTTIDFQMDDNGNRTDVSY